MRSLALLIFLFALSFTSTWFLKVLIFLKNLSSNHMFRTVFCTVPWKFHSIQCLIAFSVGFLSLIYLMDGGMISLISWSLKNSPVIPKNLFLNFSVSPPFFYCISTSCGSSSPQHWSILLTLLLPLPPHGSLPVLSWAMRGSQSYSRWPVSCLSAHCCSPHTQCRSPMRPSQTSQQLVRPMPICFEASPPVMDIYLL